jgi:hypothetical protein
MQPITGCASMQSLCYWFWKQVSPKINRFCPNNVFMPGHIAEPIEFELQRG